MATIGTEIGATLALRPPGQGWMIHVSVSMLVWRVLEAAMLTLFGSLWFDSLGSGQWWLVFLLVGLLATVPVQWLTTAQAPRRRLVFVAVEFGDLVRYLMAGALLAWRLS